jgi:hypothetical protein
MTLSIDGSNSASGSSVASITVALTTSAVNDLIVVAIHTNKSAAPPAVVSSITSTSGLVFTRRGGSTGTLNFPNDQELWTAPSTAVLVGEIITVNFAPTPFGVTIFAFGVNGIANLASPWDSSLTLPTIDFLAYLGGSSKTTNVTTNGGGILLYMICTNGGSSLVPPAGFTLLYHFATFETAIYYMAISGAQAATPITETGIANNGALIYIDAITGAAAPPVTSFTAQYQGTLTIPLFLASYTAPELLSYGNSSLDNSLFNVGTETFAGGFSNSTTMYRYVRSENIYKSYILTLEKMTINGASAPGYGGSQIMSYANYVAGITFSDTSGGQASAISFQFQNGQVLSNPSANILVASPPFISGAYRSFGYNGVSGGLNYNGHLVFASIASVFATQYALLGFDPVLNTVLSNVNITSSILNSNGTFLPDFQNNINYYIQDTNTMSFIDTSFGSVFGYYGLKFSISQDTTNFATVAYLKPTLNGWLIVCGGDLTRWFFVSKDWSNYWLLNFDCRNGTIPARPGQVWNASAQNFSMTIYKGVFYFAWNDGINTTHFANSQGQSIPKIIEQPVPFKLPCVPYCNVCNS